MIHRLSLNSAPSISSELENASSNTWRLREKENCMLSYYITHGQAMAILSINAIIYPPINTTLAHLPLYQAASLIRLAELSSNSLDRFTDLLIIAASRESDTVRVHYINNYNGHYRIWADTQRPKKYTSYKIAHPSIHSWKRGTSLPQTYFSTLQSIIHTSSLALDQIAKSFPHTTPLFTPQSLFVSIFIQHFVLPRWCDDQSLGGHSEVFWAFTI